MDEVAQAKPLSMSFCLECHRNPAQYVRPPEEVFNLDWQRPENFTKTQGQELVKHWNLNLSQSCSACHR
jgi:hypothetical protein